MRGSRGIAAVAISLAVLLAALAGAANAAANVIWTAQAEWGPAVLKPGGDARFTVRDRNYGTTASQGPIKVVDQLPAGVIATAAETLVFGGSPPTCTGIGTSTVTCTGGEQALPPTPELPFFAPWQIAISVHVSPKASGTGTNTVTVSGGGAANPAVLKSEVPFGDVPDEFGFTPANYAADVYDKDFPAGAPERQAGSHPSELRVDFGLNLGFHTDPVGHDTYLQPVGRLRTVDVTLPRGLIGNPEAAPKCKPLDFLAPGQATSLTSSEATGCPPDTQVGTLNVSLGEGSQGAPGSEDIGPNFGRVAVYNLQPPKGTPADFGFQLGGFAIGHIYASLDAGRDYAIRATSPYITDLFPIRGVRFKQWGVAADPDHDIFRVRPIVFGQDGNPDPKAPIYGGSFTGPIKPFFTLPSDCGVDNGGFRISGDSWNEPGQFTEPIEDEHHLNVTGCDDQRIRFHPDVALNPTSRAAGGPTGLDVHLEVPQRDQTVEDYESLYPQNGDLHGIDTPPMKKAVITLPKGMTLSTSAAQGLTGCTPEQIGLGTNSPVSCPDASQYGQITLHTPILPPDEPMHGYIYIAQQNKNPFGTFLAMYFVIEDQDRGLRVKIPGKLELDPKSGQITTTFDDLPQFPVSDFQLSIKGGVRAGLVNPPTCGPKTITAEFFSWAAPEVPVTKSSSYEITQKPDGSRCIDALAQRQFKPGFEAGTTSPSAGSYSPFVFRMTRGDEDQEFSQLTTTLPPGLLANISKLTECPEAGIAQAGNPLRSGSEEALFPSCPPSSQIGTTEVGSGVGQVITYVPGKAYLAGPYRGEPLSMVVITPILAGPYDLGVIAVRAAIHVNGERGQASISTDPFPQIYRGIPVRIRDVRVSADTPKTIINPTNCEAMAVTAHVTGTGGDLDSTADDTGADLSSRYQAQNCASLPFKPNLTFKLKGGTRRGQFPAFSALLKGRPGDANIARSTVVLPVSEFIEQGHIRTVCTRPQYAANQCPAGSIYGEAEARSPLFDETLKGPVYLRSNGGERVLPDLVVKLNGKITVNLAGFVDSVDGRVRNTFDVVPDAPVTFFALRMQGGKKGLLVNHLDLCSVTSRADVKLVAQNGKRTHTHPAMGTSCAKAKNKKNKKKKKTKPGRGAAR
jgi:uncharacterized repeat protein (TIGR01451 family)